MANPRSNEKDRIDGPLLVERSTPSDGPGADLLGAPDGPHAEDGDGPREVVAGGELDHPLATDAEQLGDLVGAGKFIHENHFTTDNSQMHTSHMTTHNQCHYCAEADPYRLATINTTAGRILVCPEHAMSLYINPKKVTP